MLLALVLKVRKAPLHDLHPSKAPIIAPSCYPPAVLFRGVLERKGNPKLNYFLVRESVPVAVGIKARLGFSSVPLWLQFMAAPNENHCEETYIDNGIITADFFTDIAEQCNKRLEKQQYKTRKKYEDLSSLDKNESIVHSYLNALHRRIPMRPRKIHKAEYETPSYLIEGEKKFLDKVRTGDDLGPHQSRQLKTRNYEDGMLNDFGIHHFHLGIKKRSKKSYFVSGQRYLLFALVRSDDFYCIGYYEHGDWSRSILLDTIHSNWPHAISSVIKGATGISLRCTDEEHQKLREAGVNIVTQRPDGTVYAPPGLGITAAGTSLLNKMRFNEIKEACFQLERESKDLAMKLISSGELTPPVHLRLQFVCGRFYIIVTGKEEKTSFPLRSDLSLHSLFGDW